MGCQISLSGRITVGGDGCGCSGSGSSARPSKLAPLSFGCDAVTYPAVVSTDCPVYVNTSGIPGAVWQDLPGLGSLKSYRLLYVLTKSAMLLRVGAAPATLLGASAAFPVTLAGGEVFAFKSGATTVTTTFTSGSKAAAEITTAINQAAVGAGLSYLPASVDSTGQVRLTGLATGKDGSLLVTTTLAAIGFASADSAVGAGSDLSVNGAVLLQFKEEDAPTRVQISGQGYMEMLAAGAAA